MESKSSDAKVMSDSEIASRVDEIMKKDLSDISCEILPNRSGNG